MSHEAPVLAIVGVSKSGKTAVIEQIIRKLAGKGLNIGTVKHIRSHHHSLDVKGKDSWRHAQAGARIVICSAPREIAIFRRRQCSRESIEEALDLMKDEKLDLILVEGFRSQVALRRDIPKIIVVKEEREISEALEENLNPILALVGPAELVSELPKLRIPFLSLPADGDQLSKLIMNLLA